MLYWREGNTGVKAERVDKRMADRRRRTRRAAEGGVRGRSRAAADNPNGIV